MSDYQAVVLAALRERRRELTVEQRLRASLLACKGEVSALSMHFDPAWQRGLFAQLDDLHDPENWDPDDRILDQRSFASFLWFLFLLKGFRRPGIGLTPTGNILATWTKSDARLTVECQPGDHIRWIVSHQIDGDLEVASGRTTIFRLLHQIAPYSPEQWLANDPRTTS